jgi:hypothetical protein
MFGGMVEEVDERIDLIAMFEEGRRFGEDGGGSPVQEC